MTVYSPIAATYGARFEQLLETDSDYSKYHGKLNRKLQNLRHRCKLITKDTKKYSSKEKYSKITPDDYDKKNKLFGALVLLHAERDLVYTEIFKIRGRQRGKLKDAEKKLLATRLKKALKTSENLTSLTKNESQWITRLQYLIYSKFVRVEYLMYGKQAKRKDSDTIVSDLALAFAALDFLAGRKFLERDLVEYLRSKYEPTLSHHTENRLSSRDFTNFIQQYVQSSSDDEISKILFANGFSPFIMPVNSSRSKVRIQWRAFNCQIKDSHVAQLLADAKYIPLFMISNASNRLMKYEEALSAQQYHISQSQYDEEEGEDAEKSQENDQILLFYIKYMILVASIRRDDLLFKKLWRDWSLIGTSMYEKLTKYKEITRIVNNLQNYLREIVELPGVYADDELVLYFELSALYYQLHSIAGCLAELYQTKGRYMEALALYVDSYKKLEEKLQNCPDLNKASLAIGLITNEKLKKLQSLIRNNWKNVVALAEYEGTSNNQETRNTVVENIDQHRISPLMIKLDNLFPLRPTLKPIGAKPTLFDLAFNYVDYPSEKISRETSPIETTPTEEMKTSEESTKRRGFLGLFGR
ncbi:hypothetical protein KAFR_0F01100 [Kazachstania africana CBS 2517]|uniref:Signal recognition particle subunit SRP68 n=1 Tax=Kazachstania africana (strain ATCC 22294 / BCRC 22015 / CBS 2517 / CECT 1963 / NBRC 1671 / NRRL Y-8276) TaxID=1071382 RepID=H2AWF6_KAZAF|nr:hypothetical protein KAFR_0F01100 [Kazachstania africana CBS 2517]CCF58706.1 hypothetical protein KAFR_0F01100 [Kazachstania africana CBS 2517]